MSECACLYGGFDGDDDCRFSSTTQHKARKAHRCYECREDIRVGESYVKVVQKYDDIVTYRFCLPCEEIRSALYCEGGWYWGVLWDDIYGQIFSRTGLTVTCIDKLTTVKAKQKLQAAWMRFVAERTA